MTRASRVHSYPRRILILVLVILISPIVIYKTCWAMLNKRTRQVDMNPLLLLHHRQQLQPMYIQLIRIREVYFNRRTSRKVVSLELKREKEMARAKKI